MTPKKLTLTASLAAALVGLSGCGDDDDWDTRATADTRVCVDNAGQRIDDDYCERRVGGSSFFYLGRGSRIPYYYDNVRDPRYAKYGSYTPNAGSRYVAAPASTRMARSTAVSRGGLGSSSRSFGGGRGG